MVIMFSTGKNVGGRIENTWSAKKLYAHISIIQMTDRNKIIITMKSISYF